jgi:hypothetical protein
MHIANFMRIDTGGFMSATLRSPSTDSYAFPLQLWFEPSELIPLWFGPLVEFKTTGASDKWTIPGGIGIGYAVNPDIDLRAEVFVPTLNTTPGDRDFGGGIGATYRFR